MGGDDHGNHATGESEAPSGRDKPAPAPPLGAPLPQVLPGIAAGLQRHRGRRAGHLDRRCAGHRPWRGRLVSRPITQGAQLVDRQDLVSIRLVHNLI
jgi:hypothetical protein